MAGDGVEPDTSLTGSGTTVAGPSHSGRLVGGDSRALNTKPIAYSDESI